MKKMTVLIAALFALAAPLASLAMDHEGHDHGSMGGHKGNVAYEKVTDGVEVTVLVQTMAESMKAMGMEMPMGVKETHHVHVEFKDAKSGKALTEGEVRVKVQGPDKAEQNRKLMGMQAHFGADFELSRKGKYDVKVEYKLKDGKAHSASFKYTVK